MSFYTCSVTCSTSTVTEAGEKVRNGLGRSTDGRVPLLRNRPARWNERSAKLPQSTVIHEGTYTFGLRSGGSGRFGRLTRLVISLSADFELSFSFSKRFAGYRGHEDVGRSEEVEDSHDCNAAQLASRYVCSK